MPDELSREQPRHWLRALRTYLIVSVAGHLAWETIQLPLYTIWQTATLSQLAVAVLHCTGGDLLIALASLVGALITVGNSAWPSFRFARVGALTLGFGIGYTLFSEWLNTSVRGNWTYAASMPTLPWIGTGLSPLSQWILIPALSLFVIRRLSGHEARTRNPR